jgi:hypoxanthine phosphoribosyltransferase
MPDSELVYFLLGSVVSVALSPVAPWLMHRLNKTISWRQFFKGLSDPAIQNQIVPGGRAPDVIIGVNSGIVPASILALNLFVSKLVFIHTMPEYDQVGVRATPPKETLDKIGNISNLRVLIVDDQYYSGDTMAAIFALVKSLPGADSATIQRFAVSAYKSITKKVNLDVQPRLQINGVLKKVPWVFSDRLKAHYRDRNA